MYQYLHQPFEGKQWPRTTTMSSFELAELSAGPGFLLALLMLRSNFPTAVYWRTCLLKSRKQNLTFGKYFYHFPWSKSLSKCTIKHTLNNCQGVNVMIVTRSRHNTAESNCSITCSQSASVVGVSCVSICWHYFRRSLCVMVRAISPEEGLPALGFNPAPSPYILTQSWHS